jgi:integrase
MRDEARQEVRTSMNFVQPIRDKEKIAQIKSYLREKSERNYMMFTLGINTGFRISDILTLQKKHIQSLHISIREKKTRKQKRVRITPDLGRDLKNYMANLSDDDYLFRSREGVNKPISPSMAYKILREAADHFKLKEIGTHTLRKSFGYHFYKQYKDAVMLMKLFNHSSVEITLRYIGITQDHLDDAMSKFVI